MSQPESLEPSVVPFDDDLNPTIPPALIWPVDRPFTLPPYSPILYVPRPTRRPTLPPSFNEDTGNASTLVIIIIFSIFATCWCMFRYMQNDPTEVNQDPTAGVVHRFSAPIATHKMEGVQAIELEEVPEAEQEAQPARFEPTTAAEAVEAEEVHELTEVTEVPSRNGAQPSSLDLTYPSPTYPTSYAEAYAVEETK